jgi:competence protein ComEC
VGGSHVAEPAERAEAGRRYPRRDPAHWFVRRAGLARFTTIACALGLALSAATGARPVLALTGLTTALVGTLGGVLRRDSRWWSLLLVLAVLMTGLFSGLLLGSVRVAVLGSSRLQSWIGRAVEAELVFTGQVRENSGWRSVTAAVRWLSEDGSAGTGAVSTEAVARADTVVGETVWLEVPPAEDAADGSRADPQLEQGMIVVCRGTIGAPEGESDSGFDQARQLRHQGIEVVLEAGGARSVVVLGRRGGVSGWFDRLRSAARAHLSRGPNARANEVLQGVVMGDTAGIDEGWLEAFRRSGTAHMLSVSGLHLAGLAAIMIGIARLLGAARWVGFVLAAVAALLMIPFVGPSPPLVRSAVMIVIVLIGRWVGRGRDQWQILALAAVAILALNPYALFDVGFQLSFAAFGGMLALTACLQRLLKRLPRSIASNVAVSVAASAGTAPVALAVFGRTSLVSPLANLLVVPTLPLVTGLGLASVFLGFIWSGFSAALDSLASLPMIWTVLVSRLMAVAPVLGSADLGRALTAVVMGAALLPAALALTGRAVRTPLDLPLPFFTRSLGWLRAHRPRSRRRALGLGAALVICGMVLGQAAYPAGARGFEAIQVLVGGRSWPGKVEIRILDIGQGNAVLVRTPERHALLFDGGPADCDLAGQLHALGVRELDLVVISHPHADHFAGLLRSLAGVEVRTLVDHVKVVPPTRPAASNLVQEAAQASSMSDHGEEASEYLELRRRLAEDGCRYALAVTGSKVEVDGVKVRFFAPTAPLVLVDSADPWADRGDAPTGDELNRASLVAVVSVEEADVLLPGDAEAEVLGVYGLPPTEVVVVPHHGSRGAVSTRLLEALGARAAVISVGEGNSFGHPYAGTLSALAQAMGTVVRTDTAGWVCCRVDGDQIVITTERTSTR